MHQLPASSFEASLSSKKRCAGIPSETYTFIHGKPQVSFLVFTYALTASGGDKGGFAVVPGS